MIHLQSGNMTDRPYDYLMARNQLTLPADPVSVVLICVSTLVHPVAGLDRQGVVELPC
jgi:hypothetical protein